MTSRPENAAIAAALEGSEGFGFLRPNERRAFAGLFVIEEARRKEVTKETKQMRGDLSFSMLFCEFPGSKYGTFYFIGTSSFIISNCLFVYRETSSRPSNTDLNFSFVIVYRAGTLVG